MLKERLISAAILIICALAAAFSGGWLLTIFALAVVGICLFEAFSFSFGGERLTLALLTVAGMLPCLGWLLCAETGIGCGALLALFVIHGVSLWNISSGEPLDNLDSSVPLLGGVYAWIGGFGTCFFIAVVKSGGGLPLIWFLTVVAFSDTGAYFAGKKFGKRKLAERVSPGKTIEGSIGGLALAITGGMLLAEPLGVVETSGCLLVVTFGISLLTQFGDLVQSMFKRAFDVKDSGNWIPGHGGLLDRVDGLIVASPLLLCLAS